MEESMNEPLNKETIDFRLHKNIFNLLLLRL